MVTYENAESAVMSYLESQIFPHLGEVDRFAIKMGVLFKIRRMRNSGKLRSMGMEDENGMLYEDEICDAAKSALDNNGLKVSIGEGTFTINGDDIEDIRRRMK